MKTIVTTPIKYVATTAHRPDKLGMEYDYQGPYSDYARLQYRNYLEDLRPDIAISGMAIGGDTIFALIALELNITVWAAIPFEGQERKWPKKSRDLYHEILNNSLVTTHQICEGGYANWKFQVRNEWMVDKCDLLLALFNGSTGGTRNTTEYAYKVRKPVTVINPDGWRSSVETDTFLF